MAVVLRCERSLIQIPRGVPLEIAGPLACRIQTAGTVLNSMNVPPARASLSGGNRRSLGHHGGQGRRRHEDHRRRRPGRAPRPAWSSAVNSWPSWEVRSAAITNGKRSAKSRKFTGTNTAGSPRSVIRLRLPHMPARRKWNRAIGHPPPTGRVRTGLPRHPCRRRTARPLTRWEPP